MRLTILLTCFFVACCEPLLVEGQKKMVFVIPRVIRRTHSPVWRQYIRPAAFSKSPQYLENESRPHPKSYHPYPHHKFPTKGKPIFFHQNEAHSSGDDFGRDREKVNHVVIPHGKGITHGVTYGRGYIPRDSFKDHHQASFTEAPPSHGSVEDNELNYYPHTRVASQPSHSYLPQPQQQTQDDVEKESSSSYQQDSYENIQDRGTNEYKPKYFTSKPFHSKVFDFPKKPFFSSDSFFSKDKFAPTSKEIEDTTFNGNKEQVVVKETVDFSEYQKKLMELAKNWPAAVNLSPALSTATSHDSFSSFGGASQQSTSSDSFQPSSFPVSNILAPFSLTQQPEQQQQPGYAVKEDVQDVPHDFRTQPIQTAPVEPNPQNIYQAPVPQIQHIIPQQSYPQIIQYGYQGGAPGYQADHSGLLQG